MSKKSEVSVQYLASLVDSAAHCIVSTDKDGTITSINRAGEKMFGYKAEELIGEHVSIIQAPSVPHALREKLKQKADRGEQWETESLGIRKDGTTFPIWLVTSYLWDEEGNVKGAVGISRDLTESKEYEEKLRYMAELVESAANCVISTDRGGIVTSINRAGEKMFGYRAKELVGRPVSILWSEETPKELREKLAKLAKKGKSWEAESLGVRKNGEVFPIWLATSYLRDEKGNIKGAVGISRDLTQFKEYEEKLRYMAELLESAAHCIISTNANGIVTSINRAGENMFGYSAKELIGRPVSILWSEETPKELREKLAKLAAKGESWEAESLGVRKNGEVFPIWLATSYLRDEEGNIKGAVGISRDLTQFKEYEEKLRYMAELVESASHCVISTDENGFITSVNQAGETMFGYRADELIGKNISILNSEKNNPALLEELRKKADKGESWEGEVLDRKKDGTHFPIWLATSYLFDSSGKRRGGISIIRDITEQKRIEEKLRYMADLVEKASLGVISTNPENIIVSINKAGEEMYGYKARELIGHHTSILYSDKNPDYLIEQVKEKADKLQPWSAELCRRRKDGSDFISWLSTAYLYDETGKLKAKVCIEKDVTEQREIEKKLAESAHLASLGELAAGVAHEIRNPLGGILTSAKMILEEEGLEIGEDGMSLLKIIEKESTRLEAIVTDFLRFGRPREPILSKMDINQLIKELLNSLRRDQTLKEGIAVELDFAAGPAFVLIDENQIRQVFLNLILNALQAMGDEVKLKLNSRVNKDTVKICLEDTGCGMCKEDLDNIFKPFFSTKKGGTGLGLPIVKRIVDTHHGSIRCESQLNKGTRFIVTLPLVGSGGDIMDNH